MAQIEPTPVEEKKAIELGDGLELDDDGVIRKGKEIATASDVSARDDLPADHPLRGQRVLRVVPSGWPDCVIGTAGRLEPIEKAAEPVDAEITEVSRG